MDLKINLEEGVLNIRVGIILYKGNEVVLEISKIGDNSAVPGGRVRFNETSFEAIQRELIEEMTLKLDNERIEKVNTYENFFEYGTKFHEIFFLYRYCLSDDEYNYIKNIGNNKDNVNTYFEIVDNSKLEELDLLPTLLYDVIRK